MAYSSEKRIIQEAAHKYGIDPSVLWGVYGAETNFGKNKSHSRAGAVGPFQFMPSTAAGLGIDPNNFRQAAFGAARYLSQYKNRGTRGMLAAYNAGPGGNPQNPETAAYVPRVLELGKSFGASGGSGTRRYTGSTTTTIPGRTDVSYAPGVDNSATRDTVIQNYFANREKPGALLDLIVGLKSAQDTPGTFTYKTIAAQSITSKAATDQTTQFKAAADMLNAAHEPYKWGGGHGKKLNLLKGGKPIPVDCSGAVSAVLGINPRVAAEFKSWGRSGEGKRVTVWAAKDGSHVLMEINGHFFGTSGANPGGGAGWIPRKHIDKQYLSRFVARHPAGL